MIGLLDKGRPVLGVVYLPFRDEWYYGEAGKGSYRVKDGETTRLQVPRTTQIEDAVLVGRNPSAAGDVRPIEEAVAQLGFKSTVAEGSIGAKIGLIAAGEADAHVHTNLKAGKWDTLASEVILTEAGGPPLRDVDGKLLDYTKPESGWNRYFMAACTPKLLEEMSVKLGAINEANNVF
jgi:3'(2'), 5'-bisphosphate nucleotidase